MIPLYALTLDFAGDHLDDLADHARRWLASKYARWDGTLLDDDDALVLRPDHTVRHHAHASPAGRLFSLALEHPDSRYAPLRWHTSITAATDGHTSECSVVISTKTSGYVDAPPRPEQIQTPNVVKEIVRTLHPTLGREPVALAPISVGPDEGNLLADILLTPGRALPLVVVSEASGMGTLVDPDALQKRLLGYARVVHVAPAASYALSDRLGRDLSCFDGGVRIYWPGFTSADDRARHKLYLKWEIREMDERGPALPDALFERLLSAAVARFDGGRLATRIRNAAERARQEAFDARRYQIARQETLTAEDRAVYDALLDESEATIRSLQADRNAREAYVLEQAGANEALRRELDQALANLRSLQEYVDAPPAEPVSASPHALFLSRPARRVYDAELSHRSKFDALLAKLADDDHRAAISRPNSGGSFVGGQGHSDERAFWVLVGGRPHVCELFPTHDDGLADRYNALRNGALLPGDYTDVDEWTPPAA